MFNLLVCHEIPVNSHISIRIIAIHLVDEGIPQGDGIVRHITENVSSPIFRGTEDQNLFTGSGCVIPFFPGCHFTQEDHIFRKGILVHIVNVAAGFLLSMFGITGDANSEIHIQISAFLIPGIIQIHDGIAAGNDDVLQTQGLTDQFFRPEGDRLTDQLQIVFLYDFVQLILHFLGVDIIGGIFCREFRDTTFTLQFDDNGMIRIIFLFEGKPFLCSLIIPAALNTCQGQYFFRNSFLSDVGNSLSGIRVILEHILIGLLLTDMNFLHAQHIYNRTANQK